MHTLNISPKVMSDIEEIQSYITNELNSPKAANKLISKIIEKIENLKDFPLVGSPLQTVIKIPTDYRFLVAGNYLIFYRFEHKTVYVLRVLYGKSDYASVLFS